MHETQPRPALYLRIATFKDSEGNDLQIYEPPS